MMPGYEQFTKISRRSRAPRSPRHGHGGVMVADGKGGTQRPVKKCVWISQRARGGRAATGELSPHRDRAVNIPGGRGVGGGRGGVQSQGGLEQAQHEMPVAPMAGCPAGGVPRGRQAECVLSPDGKFKAFYRARNFWIANADGTAEVQVTTDGSVEKRIKNGSGSWVYGEELGQTTAIWWAPNSQKVGYYRFGKQGAGLYLGMNSDRRADGRRHRGYRKPARRIRSLKCFVYDLAAGTSKKIDVRDGQAFSNDFVGHYVYGQRWSPDGTELLMNRTNRKQNVMELAACNPTTAKCRVVVREEWATGWVDNTPTMRLLKDQKRFIWGSERNGFANYYLYDLTGKLINPITKLATAEAANIVKLDEHKNVMFYMARDGDNYMKTQLHRVNLDGTGDVRLTDPKFDHSVTCATGSVRWGGGGAAGQAAVVRRCGISPDNVTSSTSIRRTTRRRPLLLTQRRGGKNRRACHGQHRSHASAGFKKPSSSHIFPPTARRRSTGRFHFRRTSIRRRNGRRWYRCTAGLRLAATCRRKRSPDRSRTRNMVF